MHVMHEGRGHSTLYLGEKRGARYLGVDLRGSNGWCSHPAWMRGGWEYYGPTVYYGRLFMSVGGWKQLGTVKVPAKLVHAKRMLRRSYREGMREEPIEA